MELEAMECLNSFHTATASSYKLLGWDSHHHEGTHHPPLSSTSEDDAEAEADFSTGYLEDALVEFSQHYKRRRFLSYPHHQDTQTSFWNFNPQMLGFNGFSDDERTSTSVCGTLSEVKALEDEEDPHSSSSSYKSDDDPHTIHFISDTKTAFSTNPVSLSGEVGKRTEKMVGRRSRTMVYPFAVVKPGGLEGEVTLKEINDRILMPPTRPLRHPVGDFACRPCVCSNGVGPSGKAVVALTRIQTHGRGTITIIRTKT